MKKMKVLPKNLPSKPTKVGKLLGCFVLIINIARKDIKDHKKYLESKIVQNSVKQFLPQSASLQDLSLNFFMLIAVIVEHPDLHTRVET